MLAGLDSAKAAAYQTKSEEINRKYPAPRRANVEDFVDHIDYAVKLIGIDHVGISSDFDGGGWFRDWRDAGDTANVTAELVRRGYDAGAIAKLWGGNFLRVMRAAEAAAE